jgi:hypothetical protein
VSKNCENRTDAPCAFKYNHLNKGCPNCSLDSNAARFFLNDGTLIGVVAQNYINATSGLPYRQAAIYIDVNGQKKPNLQGRDIFFYYYHV